MFVVCCGCNFDGVFWIWASLASANWSTIFVSENPSQTQQTIHTDSQSFVQSEIAKPNSIFCCFNHM